MSLTDNEIVRAFVCCHIEKQNCIDCPAIANDTDCVNIEKLFVDMFNRLQADKDALIAGQETLQKALAEKDAKIEALQMDNAQLQSDNINANMNCEHLQAEIERLQKAGEEAVSCFHRMESLYNIKRVELKVAKAEAYKEIIEKLKSKLCICDDNFNPVVTEKEIDDTFKEMVAMINEKHI